MPSNDVIDLSLDDDDEPAKSGNHAQPDRSAGANGRKKSNIGFVRPSDRPATTGYAKDFFGRLERPVKKPTAREMVDQMRLNAAGEGRNKSSAFSPARKSTSARPFAASPTNFSVDKERNRALGGAFTPLSAKTTPAAAREESEELPDLGIVFARRRESTATTDSERAKGSSFAHFPAPLNGVKRPRETDRGSEPNKSRKLDVRHDTEISSSASVGSVSARRDGTPLQKTNTSKTSALGRRRPGNTVDLTSPDQPAKRVPIISTGVIELLSDDDEPPQHVTPLATIPRPSSASGQPDASLAKQNTSSVHGRSGEARKSVTPDETAPAVPAQESPPRTPSSVPARKNIGPTRLPPGSRAASSKTPPHATSPREAKGNSSNTKSPVTEQFRPPEPGAHSSPKETTDGELQASVQRQHVSAQQAQPESTLSANETPRIAVLNKQLSPPPRSERDKIQQEPERVDSGHSDGEDSVQMPQTFPEAASAEKAVEPAPPSAEQETPSKRESGVATSNAASRTPQTNVEKPKELTAVHGPPKGTVQQYTPPDEVEPDPFMALAASPIVKQSAPPLAALGLSKQVELVVGKYLEELRGDNEYWTKALLKRARLSLAKPGMARTKPSKALGDDSSTDVDTPYSFANLRPLQSPAGSSTSMAQKVVKFQVERFSPAGSKTAVKTQLACSARILSFPTDIPGYAHFVNIRSNYLAPNITALHFMPYFDDEFNYDLNPGIRKQFEKTIDVKPRSRKLLRLLQAEKLEGYAEGALSDLQITWTDIIRFLLETIPDVGSDEDARKASALRRDSCAEDFSRKGERTVIILSSLAPSASDRLAKAAILCENFLKLAKVSLWHVARRHLFDAVLKDDTPESQEMLDALTCKLCLRFDCAYHGELMEQDGDGEVAPETASDEPINTDIIHPPRTNFRSRLAFRSKPEMPARVEGESTEKDETKGLSRGVSGKSSKKSLLFWQSSNFVTNVGEREPFYPCHHPGTTCEVALCSCFEQHLPCEKICGCAPECGRKFQGCICKRERTRKGLICFQDDRCICFALGRECDPDLCGDCGAYKVLDPVNRYDDDVVEHHCHNANIQRARPKHTLMGDSGIHGLGLYAGETIKQHDFVGEYKGEVIGDGEIERRGAAYDELKLSYLFDLNKSQSIDSTYFGNKIRFINHASREMCNLYPRVFLVNAIHRIALFAGCDISCGTELFFDYGPKFTQDYLGGKKQTKRTKRMADALNHDYFDVGFQQDDFGNTRATKMAGRSGGKKGKAVKAPVGKRGGARVGAGRKRTLKSAPTSAPGEDEDDEMVDQEAGAEEDVGDADVQRSAADRLAMYNIQDNGSGETEEQGVEDEDFEPDEYEEEGESQSVDEESGPEPERADGRPRRRGAAMAGRGRGRRGGWRS